MIRSPRIRVPRFRTLRARLIAGVVALLVAAFAVIAAGTYLAVRGSMTASLSAQLRQATVNYYHCNTRPPGGGPPGHNPDGCAFGQPQGMLGIRVKDGAFRCGVVTGISLRRCALSAAGKRALLALSVTRTAPGAAGTGPLAGAAAPARAAVRTVTLASPRGSYLVTAVSGPGGTELITGLNLAGIRHVLGQVALAELFVFLAVLALAAVLGTVLVRLALRPLRRVAATATTVAELPLEAGEVSLPPGVPDAGQDSEVGRVSAAFNRMLGHVERALSRRAASEARLRRFAADASHELRTPLASIQGYTELALRHPGPVPGEVGHALRRVHAESRRMSVLVDDLLLLARLDAGRPLASEPVDLLRLAADVGSDARVTYPGQHWRLDLPERTDDAELIVTGDEHRLRQVLVNIASNAGKHTPPGSTVTVTVRGSGPDGEPARGPGPDVPVRRGRSPEPPFAEITITDDGPGIAPELLPELFERFTRADTSRSRAGASLDGASLDGASLAGASLAGTAHPSTGLGLAIVEAVITAHQGGITVTSRPGHTSFAIRLPARPAS